MPISNSSLIVPIIPQTTGLVLLPGIIQRLPVTPERADIPSLLAAVYTRAAAQKSPSGIQGVPVACIPLSSEAFATITTSKSQEVDDEKLQFGKKDFNPCGVRAKITGVDGSGASGEFALLVRGVSRIRIEKIVQEHPFFEAKVTEHTDDIDLDDVELQKLFRQLKATSEQFVAILNVTAMIANHGSSLALSPLVAKKLEYFIAHKELKDAGYLADFMTNLVSPTYDEKLDIVATWDVKQRLSKVIAMLTRQTNNLKSSTRIMWSSTQSLARLPGQRRLSLPVARIGSSPPTFSGIPPIGDKDSKGSREPSELDELQERLDAAKLPSEAGKVAAREMRRLRQMHPNMADFQSLKTYLETLAEIPWAVVTTDQLGPDTIKRARSQLDQDHYGLDKVKTRLIEYLGVLRLKQSANEENESKIKLLEEQLLQEGEQREEGTLVQQSKLGKAVNTPPDEAKQKAIASQLETLKSERLPDRSPILLLVGPPGVGKTSLAKSVATALGRKFHRISLGGIRDEAEIRGHRRTYVASLPGRIVQGIKKAGVANPVLLLDEVDKAGSASHHGDPSAALLEVLDPEQNSAFQDHYLGVPIDLSRVLFIATANELNDIPPPLLDRMEMIYVPGYTQLEKREIAIKHLIPKQIKSNGLTNEQLVFTNEVVTKIIESYTREAGVRNLEREIASVCRAKAVELAEAKDGGHPEKYQAKLTVEDVERILGIEKYEEEIAEKTSRPGVVTGLVAYSSGGNGSILFIEVASMPGKGTVQLTGKLGDVLKESVEVALSWVKTHAFALGLTEDPKSNIMEDRSIHVHCPSGAVPKDGPSSGMAQAIAMISLFSSMPVNPQLAMTGEISLRGRVTAVGGIKEKLIGALRAGVKKVLLPAQNKKDARDLPQEVKDGLEIVHVSNIWEAIREVWPEHKFPGMADPNFTGLESRL